MSREYTVLPDAEDDIFEIWRFIAEDNLEAADRIEAEIRDSFGQLAEFPAQGHRRPDLTTRPLRFWRVRSYLIAYAPNETPLMIVAILHGKRSPKLMAAILRGREQ
jgi:antitoxin ParD1/3/4/toxin ParE1/3/4